MVSYSFQSLTGAPLMPFLKTVGPGGEGIQHHIPAVAVTAYGHIVGINPGFGGQVGGGFVEIKGFPPAQIPVDHFLEIASPATAATIVHTGYDEALTGQVLSPHVGFELIVDRLRAGSAVNIQDNRIGLVFIESLRQDDHHVQAYAITGLEAVQGGRVISTLLQVGLNGAAIHVGFQDFSVGPAKVYLARLIHCRPAVQEVAPVRGYIRTMPTCIPGYLTGFAAIQIHPVQMPLQR